MITETDAATLKHIVEEYGLDVVLDHLGGRKIDPLVAAGEKRAKEYMESIAHLAPAYKPEILESLAHIYECYEGEDN